jgi:hypothetical protein
VREEVREEVEVEVAVGMGMGMEMEKLVQLERVKRRVEVLSLQVKPGPFDLPMISQEVVFPLLPLPSPI